MVLLVFKAYLNIKVRPALYLTIFGLQMNCTVALTQGVEGHGKDSNSVVGAVLIVVNHLEVDDSQVWHCHVKLQHLVPHWVKAVVLDVVGFLTATVVRHTKDLHSHDRVQNVLRVIVINWELVATDDR